ncbi:MAG: prepilin-type N-terminal cleavage/methylation domain-containing protein [Gammaproteobacteria bacterium]|nr:prepilin-type N-terminal cleavage/methylation domain-containing protein [Gammaproteobacteria bacterium]
MIKQASSYQGLSLIEVMISMAIGSVVILGVLSLFNANTETYNALQAQTRLHEGANFGLNVIARDLRRAGYRGCYSRGSVYSAVGSIPAAFDIRSGLSVHNGNSDGSWTASSTELGSDLSDNAIDGTDIITLRFVENDEAYLSTTLVTGQENIQLAVVSGASTNIEVNDLALISDCEKATLFKVTSVAVSGTAMTLGHVVSGASGNVVDGLAETGTFGTDAAVASIVSKTYFIKEGASGLAGKGGYSLFQFDGTASAELVEGVEDLQILLGIDTDSDGVPNQYLDPNAAVNTGQIVAILLEITANSISDAGSTEADGLLRRTFRQTIKIRNPG